MKEIIRNQKKILLQLLLALFIAGMLVNNAYKLIQIATDIDTVRNTDFVSYYTSGQLVRDGYLKQIYNLELQEKYYKENTKKNHFFPYRALPQVSIMFVPLSLISLQNAYLIYLGTSFIFIFIVTRKLEHPYWGPLAIAFSPLAFSLAHGQTAVLVLLGMGMAFNSVKKRNILLAGLWYSLGLFKFQFLVGLPFALLVTKEKWKFLGGVVGVIAICGVSSFFVDGGIISLGQMLLSTETFELGSNPKGLISGQYFLQNALEIDPIASIAITLVMYAILWVVIFFRQDTLKQEEIYTIAILVSLLFGYHTHIHDQILLLIPALLLVRDKKYNLMLLVYFSILTIFYAYSPILTTPLLSLAILYILNYKYPNEKNRRDHQKQKQIS